MNLNNNLAKLSLYSLAAQPSRPYSISDGVAVQIYASIQFADFLRPTSAANIISPSLNFVDFERRFGDELKHYVKNHFNLGVQTSDFHGANIVTLIQNGDYSSNESFILRFGRYKESLEGMYEMLLDRSINVPFSIISKGLDSDYASQRMKEKNLNLTVVSQEDLLEIKKAKMRWKRKNGDIELPKDFARIRTLALHDMPFDVKLNSLYEQVLHCSAKNPEQYHFVKDIYDFALLKKVIGK